MSLHPCVKFIAAGSERTLWLDARERLTISGGEAGLRHAIEIARQEGGADIRIEFFDGASCVLRMAVR